MFRALTLVALALMSSSALAASSLEKEAKDFLVHYVHLGNSFDPAVADLYADDAVIRTFRRYPHGLQRAMELKGAQWKALVRQVMPQAKAQNDRSEYKEPQFSINGDKVKITAKRYSVRKCYWDPEYYMVLARQPDGSLKIIEEYTETQPQSSC